MLLDGNFLNRMENVLAFGNPGGRKSHRICALGDALSRSSSSGSSFVRNRSFGEMNEALVLTMLERYFEVRSSEA